jgi:hypothetical protein
VSEVEDSKGPDPREQSARVSSAVERGIFAWFHAWKKLDPWVFGLTSKQSNLLQDNLNEAV